MSKRNPTSSEAAAAAINRLNEVMRRFCEDVERRKAPAGVLAQLDEQPREA